MATIDAQNSQLKTQLSHSDPNILFSTTTQQMSAIHLGAFETLFNFHTPFVEWNLPGSDPEGPPATQTYPYIEGGIRSCSVKYLTTNTVHDSSTLFKWTFTFQPHTLHNPVTIVVDDHTKCLVGNPEGLTVSITAPFVCKTGNPMGLDPATYVPYGIDPTDLKLAFCAVWLVQIDVSKATISNNLLDFDNTDPTRNSITSDAVNTALSHFLSQDTGSMFIPLTHAIPTWNNTIVMDFMVKPDVDQPEQAHLLFSLMNYHNEVPLNDYQEAIVGQPWIVPGKSLDCLMVIAADLIWPRLIDGVLAPAADSYTSLDVLKDNLISDGNYGYTWVDTPDNNQVRNPTVQRHYQSPRGTFNWMKGEIEDAVTDPSNPASQTADNGMYEFTYTSKLGGRIMTRHVINALYCQPGYIDGTENVLIGPTPQLQANSPQANDAMWQVAWVGKNVATRTAYPTTKIVAWWITFFSVTSIDNSNLVFSTCPDVYTDVQELPMPNSNEPATEADGPADADYAKAYDVSPVPLTKEGVRMIHQINTAFKYKQDTNWIWKNQPGQPFVKDLQSIGVSLNPLKINVPVKAPMSTGAPYFNMAGDLLVPFTYG